MGVASHLGPWLLGTQKNNNGATNQANVTAGLVRNMGATHSIQFKTVSVTDTTAQTPLAVLPAGSCIQSIAYLVTNAYTTIGQFQFFVNGTQINSAAAPSGITTGTGRGGFTLGTSNPSLVSNVGTTDALISFTQTLGAGTGAGGVLEISYIVRNSDGSINPTSYTA